MKEDKFKIIYAQFFPRGADTNGYARFVFNSFDIQRKQEITFTDFVIGLSVLTRGTIDERLRWIFTLYDLNADGVITRDELAKIINSVHDLMGRYAVSPNNNININNQAAESKSNQLTSGGFNANTSACNATAGVAGGGLSQISSQNQAAANSSLNLSNVEQAENLFKKFDLNNDGVITLDEFLEACHKVSQTLYHNNLFLTRTHQLINFLITRQIQDDNIIKSISVFNTVL